MRGIIDMIIFYTIHLKDFRSINEAPVPFFQLWYSIYSIRSRLGSKIRILIYTDNFKKTNILRSLYPNIELREAEKKDRYYSGDYAGDYGHLRIPLFKKLLKEFKSPVLYLDPDTGLSKEAGPQNIARLEKEKKPLAYSNERYNYFFLWNKPVRKFIPDFYHLFKIRDEAYIRNNGIMFFPFNAEALALADELLETYEKVYSVLHNSLALSAEKINMGNVWFADMIATSILWEHHGLKTMVNNPMDKSWIVHYYMNKYSSTRSQYKKFIEGVKAKYGRLKIA